MLHLGYVVDKNGDVAYQSSVSAIRKNKGNSLLSMPDDYTVIDLETTGLDTHFDEIIEIGAIRVRNGVETNSFESFVKPESPVSDFITDLTGITNEMLSNAPSLDSVLPRFMDFIELDAVVGHNINFDINFLYDKAIMLGIDPITNNFVDTLRLSRRLYPELPNHKLKTLSDFLGIPEDAEHRAISDCRRTMGCMESMRAHANEIGGISMILKHNSRAKDIAATTSDFDQDSPVFGMSFAFTGKLDRMTRKEAMQMVADAGGICCDGVTSITNYLVLGNNDYCSALKGGKSSKQKKAEKMQIAGNDIAIISEDVFLDMLGR